MVTAISAIVLLGILIFVHELGHFIIAKLSGVGVVKFSLGFGPKLLSKKIGETEYLLSAVPLGGYVKMIGEDPDEEEEVSEEDQHKSFSNKPLIKRTAIVLAGPLFNIIFAVFVLSIIYMSGVPILKSEVGDVMEGAPAHNAGIKKGDLIISINEEEISQWDELTKIIQDSEGRELDVRVERGDAYYNFLLKPELLPGKNIFGEDIESYKIGITP